MRSRLAVGATRASPLLFVLAGSVGGCAGTAEEESRREAPVETAERVGTPSAGSALRGVLFLTGTEPAVIVVLRGDDGSSVTLTGALRDELRRLSGATVQVSGARHGEGPMARFDVDGYDVLEIDGEKPVVGILHERNGQVSIGEGKASVRLSAVPDGLGRLLGAKVWVIGQRVADSLRVQSYGVIREP